jgi:Lrp/AsnC family transcriptional regulator for asnA, asnC and gidA
MGIFLKKASLFDKVVKMLEEIPEVVECHYTTGEYAMFIKIFAKSNEHLKRILHDRLQNIPGISSTETIISLDESFKRQLPIE